MVNGKVTKPSTVKDVLFGWLNLIFAGILSMLVSLFTAGVMNKSIIIKGIVGLCTLAILVCIIGNYAYNCAKHHKAYERTFKQPHSNYNPILISIIISLPLIIQWIALLILKIMQSPIGDKVFTIYRTINAYYLPCINVICPNHTLVELSFMGMFTMFVFTMIPIITYIVVYNITYHNIDIEKILIYNRD